MNIMKNNIIIVDSQSRSFERALEETNKVAAYMGLSVQDAQGQRLMIGAGTRFDLFTMML